METEASYPFLQEATAYRFAEPNQSSTGTPILLFKTLFNNVIPPTIFQMNPFLHAYPSEAFIRLSSPQYVPHAPPISFFLI